MKTLRLYLTIAVASVLAMASCKKEETKVYKYDVHHSPTDGQARIKGTVKYLNAATNAYEVAPSSVIKIASDTTTKLFDQYWMTDSVGYYSVKGLSAGSYYITAQYKDAFTGAVFNSPGAIVIVNNAVDDVTLDFQLK